MTQPMQAMQATMLTFGGAPVTIVGALHLVTGTLIITGSTPKPLHQRNTTKAGPAAFVTDNWRAEDFDGLFSFAEIIDAVMEMRSMQSQGLLVLDKGAQRWQMESAVAFDGMDDNGKPKIRLNSGAENAHAAILALCWLSRRLLEAEHVAQAGQQLVAQSMRGQETVFARNGAGGTGGVSRSHHHNIVAGTGLFSGLFFFGSQPPGGE